MIDLMPAILAIVVLTIIWSIYRLHRNPNVEFQLFDLLMENNRVSKVSVIVMTAFLATTWAFITDCINRKGLDVALLAAYGGLWVAPLLMKLYNAGQNGVASTTTTTTASAVTTTEATPAKKGKKC